MNSFFKFLLFAGVLLSTPAAQGQWDQDPIWDNFFGQSFSYRRKEPCTPPRNHYVSGGFRQFTGICENTYVTDQSGGETLYLQRFQYRLCRIKGKAKKGKTLRWGTEVTKCGHKQFTEPYYANELIYQDPPPQHQQDDWRKY